MESVKVSVLANHVGGYFFLQQRKCLICLLRPEMNEPSQPRAALNPPGALQTAFRLLKRFILKPVHKKLRNIYLFDGVEAINSKLSALKKCDVLASGMSMLLAEFSVSAGAILQLQLSTISEILRTFLDADSNVAGEVMELFKNQSVDILMYYNARSRLDMSVFLTSRKLMGLPSRIQNRATKRSLVVLCSVIEGLSSAAPVAKDKNVFMDTLYGDSPEPPTESDVALLKFVL